MFQYAMGNFLATEKNTIHKINIRAYYNDKKRSYRLDNFSITTKKANLPEIFFVKKFRPENYLDESYWKNHDDWIGEKYLYPIENKIRKNSV